MAFSPEIDIRRKILDETRQLLIEKGINDLSIRMISRSVGCSVGTIYFYFENKDVLVHALIEEGFELMVDRQENGTNATAAPADKLRQICRVYFDFAMENPEYYEIMFSLNPERMARYPAEKYRRARRSLEIFADAIKEAAPHDDDSYMTAHLVWTFLHGVITMLQAERIDRRISREKFVGIALDQIQLMCLRKA